MARFSPTVVDHFTNPRNAGELAHPDVRAFVGNPVCGDQILLTATVTGGAVGEIRFQAYGCSAALAVGSLLTTVIAGAGLDQVAGLDADRIRELTGGLAPEQRHAAALGADVAHRLVDNYRRGVSDDAPVGCPG